MKRLVALALVLVMVIGLYGCFDIITVPTVTKPSTQSSSTTKRPPVDYSGYDGDINADQQGDFERLFDPLNLISFKLDISDKELAKIQADYEKYSSFGSKSPIYRMADLYVSITTPDGEEYTYCIEQVGVRMKGNTSRTSFYNDWDGMYNLVHFKISFGETFDEEEYYGSDALVWADDAEREARKDRTFATLEKIDIRWNKNDDSTYIRENYAYELYREQGILAPHTALASVDIGNDHAGVWMFYEPIDKIFLEKNLPEEALGGDLYKLGWAGSDAADFASFKSYGVEDEDKGKFYVYDLKTNKKKSDHSSLKNLIETINKRNLTREEFESVVDIESFLSFAAVSYMIGNPDDLRNNYNNCYIYFRDDTGKMIVIPYDNDRGLGVNKDWNPYGDHMTGDSPFQEHNVCGDQRNPLFKNTVHAGSFFYDEYVSALKRVSQSAMLDPEEFARRVKVYEDLYADYTAPSKKYNNAGNHSFSFDISRSDSSNMSFANYITAKQTNLARYLADPDSTPVLPQKDWNLYLRGNFYDNNWSNQEHYKFKHLGDGIYSVGISVTVNNGDIVKFKVYNNDTGEWYNFVDESCSELFVYQGGNRNVQFLKSGNYVIYFDTNTLTIRIEKETAVS